MTRYRTATFVPASDERRSAGAMKGIEALYRGQTVPALLTVPTTVAVSIRTLRICAGSFRPASRRDTATAGTPPMHAGAGAGAYCSRRAFRASVGRVSVTVMNLRQLANDESNRLSNLFLGFTVAAIAFGAHEVSQWEPSKSAAIALVAGIAWAGSFLAGVARGHAVFDAIRANGAMNEGGERHPRFGEARGAFNKANRRAGRAYTWQRWLLFGGATLFAVAALSHVLERVDVANDRRCLAIQRDMLAAQPRRRDDAELFKALGCRPQGEGSVFAKPIRWERRTVQ